MTNGAGHMRLDERGLEDIIEEMLTTIQRMVVTRAEIRASAIGERLAPARSQAECEYSAYAVQIRRKVHAAKAVSSAVPGDVRELADKLTEAACMKYSEEMSEVLDQNDLAQTATALLSISAENADLRARLDGTVGVEHIGKAG